MGPERLDRARSIVESQGGVIKTAVLRANGFCSKDITEMMALGILSKIRTGYYSLGDQTDLDEKTLVCSVVENGVICLLSAAQYHDLSTIKSPAYDVAVPISGKMPVVPGFPPILLHRYERRLYEIGILDVKTEHQAFRIYDRERTVCDLFRKRNRYGLDAALEGLKSYLFGQNVDIQKLYDYAAKLHVMSVISPYVEAMVT